jgi:RNA polymerase sigma-70 factor, ECF subfamily
MLMYASSELRRGGMEQELYRRYATRIRLYGLRHLGRADRADDLVQHVLMVVIEALRAERVRELDRLDSFVLGTCRNVALDLRKSEARRQVLLDRHKDLLTPEPEAPVVAEARLAECLEKLAERDRSVLVLTFYAERSPAQLSDDLGITTDNVRLVRHRALRRLRDCVSDREAAQ